MPAAGLITMCMYLSALTRMFPEHRDFPQYQAEISKVIQDAQIKCEKEKKEDSVPGLATEEPKEKKQKPKKK